MIQRILYAVILLCAMGSGSLAQAEGVQFNGNCTNLTWFQNTEPDLAGYRIYDRSNQSVSHTLKSTLGSGVTSITCASLQFNAGQHYSAISSFDNATPPNESPLTPDIPFVVTLDNQVSDLRVTVIGSTNFTIAFTEVTDGTGAPATYDVRIKTPTMDWGTAASVTAGTCATPLAGTTIGSTKSCTITGLTTTTPYELQLVPYRGTIGVDAVYGPLSNVTGGTTGGTIEDLGDRSVIAAFAFTQSDGTLGSPWVGGYTEGAATNSLQVVGNKIRTATTTIDSVMSYDATMPNDQWCELVISTMTGSGVRAPRCMLRMNAPGLLNGYEFTALVGLSTVKTRIGKWGNGQYTATLVEENATTWAATDILRAEIRGSALTLYRNGTLLLSVTDTTYGTGRAGIVMYSSVAVANVEVDNVRVGTFAVAGGDSCGCN